MADGGYNPSASMLNTNPDVSLKVFMGGGVPGADGGAGMDYRNDATMLQQNPGATLQKFEGGAIKVPGGEGQGRLLEDVMKLTETSEYAARNYVVRSVEELREKFGNEAAYNDFILWLGRKLKGNGGFEEFVKSRFLRIEERPAEPRTRATREEAAVKKLQKALKRIESSEKTRREAEEIAKQLTERAEVLKQQKGKEAEAAETEKLAKAAIAKAQEAQAVITASIAEADEEGEDGEEAANIPAPTVPTASGESSASSTQNPTAASSTPTSLPATPVATTLIASPTSTSGAPTAPVVTAPAASSTPTSGAATAPVVTAPAASSTSTSVVPTAPVANVNAASPTSTSGAPTAPVANVNAASEGATATPAPNKYEEFKTALTALNANIDSIISYINGKETDISILVTHRGTAGEILTAAQNYAGPIAEPVNNLSAEQQTELLELIRTIRTKVVEAQATITELTKPEPVKIQGGARKPKRTLKRASKKGRGTYKRKY